MGKVGKPDLKLTHQDGPRANPQSCSGGLRTLGSERADPGSSMEDSDRRSPCGWRDASGRVRGRTLELGWDQGLRPLNCSSLGSVAGMGDMTQPVLKLVTREEALGNNARVDPWAEWLANSGSANDCGGGGLLRWLLVTLATGI